MSGQRTDDDHAFFFVLVLAAVILLFGGGALAGAALEQLDEEPCRAWCGALELEGGLQREDPPRCVCGQLVDPYGWRAP